jgi:hypothetical protein
MKNIEVIVDKINISKHISHHLFGRNHTDKHRKTVGGIMMVIGVGIGHLSAAFHVETIHFFAEFIGTSLHALGIIPLATTMEKKEIIQTKTINHELLTTVNATVNH